MRHIQDAPYSGPNHTLQRTGGQRWFVAWWPRRWSVGVPPPPLSVERSAFAGGTTFPEDHRNKLERKYHVYDDKLSLRPLDDTHRDILW
jgi:hypothetical protein